MSTPEITLGFMGEPKQIPEFKRGQPGKHKRPKERSVLARDTVPEIVTQICGQDGHEETIGRHTVVTFPSLSSVVVEHRHGRTSNVRLGGTLYPGPSL